jgi:hypothetical protein
MEMNLPDVGGSPPSTMKSGNLDRAAASNLQFAKKTSATDRIGDWRWIDSITNTRQLAEQIEMHEWRCLDRRGCIILKPTYAGLNWPASITSLEVCKLAHALLPSCA